jgi:SAM-dependent methyltransferase
MLTKLSLSNKRKLPVWRLFDSTFPIWRPDIPISILRKFQVKKQSGNLYSVYLFGRKMILPLYYLAVLNEVQYWPEYYLPVSVKDKVVLDIGAGAGESAAFYFLNGAKKVIAVEQNREASDLSRENLRGLDVQPFNESFRLEHLLIPHDFMKMDIEGGESLLLSADYEKPFAIEAHSKELVEAINSKFGSKSVRQTGSNLWILNRN